MNQKKFLKIETVNENIYFVEVINIILV